MKCQFCNKQCYQLYQSFNGAGTKYQCKLCLAEYFASDLWHSISWNFIGLNQQKYSLIIYNQREAGIYVHREMEKGSYIEQIMEWTIAEGQQQKWTPFNSSQKLSVLLPFL